MTNGHLTPVRSGNSKFCLPFTIRVRIEHIVIALARHLFDLILVIEDVHANY